MDMYRLWLVLDQPLEITDLYPPRTAPPADGAAGGRRPAGRNPNRDAVENREPRCDADNREIGKVK
jgi:hypothetical protein